MPCDVPIRCLPWLLQDTFLASPDWNAPTLLEENKYISSISQKIYRKSVTETMRVGMNSNSLSDFNDSMVEIVGSKFFPVEVTNMKSPESLEGILSFST